MCKHSQNPQGPLSLTPEGLSPSHSLRLHILSCFLRDHTAVLNTALFLHTLPTQFCLSLHSQQFVNLFILSDWQYELDSPWKRVEWLAVCFWLVPWLSVTLLLSLKLEFIFYKPEWNVFVFQVIISILLAAVSGWWDKHIKHCAALTKRCGLAGWLLPFYCKAPAEVTGWQQRAPRHKRAVSGPMEWAGQ